MFLALSIGTVFVPSSTAPARAPAVTHLSATADRLSVIDGDTLMLGEQVVRLSGIAVPEHGATCHLVGRADSDCGAVATNALASMVRGNTVECAIGGHDDVGRPVGHCTAAGRSLNEAMVAGGWGKRP